MEYITALIIILLCVALYRLGWESALQALSANQQHQQQQQLHSESKKSNLAEEDLMYKMDGR